MARSLFTPTAQSGPWLSCGNLSKNDELAICLFDASDDYTEDKEGNFTIVQRLFALLLESCTVFCSTRKACVQMIPSSCFSFAPTFASNVSSLFARALFLIWDF